MNRRTPAAEVTLEGTGLFTGSPARCTIAPAALGTGIVFVHRGAEIPARIENLAPSPIPAFASLPARHTCLAKGAGRVLTCEHAMSALAGLSITDARITLGDSGELPIFDGSALPFAEALARVGVRTFEERVRPISPEAPVVVTSGGATIVAEPADELSFAYVFEPGPGSPLRAMAASWSLGGEDYAKAVAPARTFSTLAEAKQAQALGLFSSFSPRDLLVLDDQTGEPVENALRFTNEPARHKLLDLIGDLALAGAPVVARIVATRSGHALNHEMARALSQAHGS